MVQQIQGNAQQAEDIQRIRDMIGNIASGNAPAFGTIGVGSSITVGSNGEVALSTGVGGQTFMVPGGTFLRYMDEERRTRDANKAAGRPLALTFEAVGNAQREVIQNIATNAAVQVGSALGGLPFGLMGGPANGR